MRARKRVKKSRPRGQVLPDGQPQPLPHQNDNSEIDGIEYLPQYAPKLHVIQMDNRKQGN